MHVKTPINHFYTYFSFRPNDPELQCLMGNAGIGTSFVSGFTSCETGDPTYVPSVLLTIPLLVQQLTINGFQMETRGMKI